MTQQNDETLYMFLHRIAEHLSKDNCEKLYDYFLHSLDDDGDFLRSRWCVWDKPVSDFKFDGRIRTCLLTLKYPFDFEHDTQYFEEGEDTFAGERLTCLKLQIFLHDVSDEDVYSEDVEWSELVGFKYPIKIVF